MIDHIRRALCNWLSRYDWDMVCNFWAPLTMFAAFLLWLALYAPLPGVVW